MNHVVAVSETQEQKRQRTNLSRLHSGDEFRLGSEAGLPWTMEVLAAITAFRLEKEMATQEYICLRHSQQQQLQQGRIDFLVGLRKQSVQFAFVIFQLVLVNDFFGGRRMLYSLGKAARFEIRLRQIGQCIGFSARQRQRAIGGE